VEKPRGNWELVEYDLKARSERIVLNFSAMPIAVLCPGKDEVLYLDSTGCLYRWISDKSTVLHKFGSPSQADCRRVYVLPYNAEQVIVILVEQIYLVSMSSGAVNDLKQLPMAIRSPVMIDLRLGFPYTYLLYLSERGEGRLYVRKVEKGQNTVLATIRERPLAFKLYEQ